MNVLVTGGAGFLGYHIARQLRKKKVHTVLLDVHGAPRVTIGDVRNTSLLTSLIRNVDTVIHAAAALPLADPKEIFDVNVRGTNAVLEASLAHNIKRVIYVSSTAVYGVPKVHPLDERAPLIGVGAYGKSKIEAERACWQYMHKGLNVTIIRPKTFVGTGRLGVFEILFDWVHDNKKIPIIGSGQNKYQLLEVEDLVESMWLFVQQQRKLYNDAFNIGARDFGSVKDDLEQFFSAVGSRSHVLPIPSWIIKKPLWMLEQLHLSPLYQWVYDTADKDSYVSINKIMRVLQWTPRYSNVQALTHAYEWYEKHYHEVKAM